jgi:pimeloyl-ACP methyl ester carboxylesterase
MFTDQVDEKRALLDDLTQMIDRSGDLPVPRQPTLLVWGAQDPLFPVEIAHRLQARLPGPVQLVVIDGALHGPNVSHPEAVNAALLPFLGAPQRP